jgi:hypothetical protein
LRQVTLRFAGAFLPREEAPVFAVVPGLRAVAAPFLAVAAALAFEDFFLGRAFLAGAVCWTAVAPSALHASAIIAAIAA